MLVGALVFLYCQSRSTTLWQDEWVWALYRRGDTLATFLAPHNQHLSLIPIAIYRLLFATAGLGDYRPYRLLVILAHAACVAVLFTYARRRVGNLAALCSAALILLLGPAWANIIWPFQMAWLISLVTGLGALLMLDRGDRSGDVAASALVSISLASSGIGVVVMVGVLVELLWGQRWRGFWIIAVPGVVYALWWVVYQQTGRITSLAVIPRFVANEVASAVAGVLGLSGTTNGSASGTLLTWGRPLALITIVLLVWRLVGLRKPSPRLVALVAMASAFWFLTALSRGFIAPAEAWASRYLYVGGMLVVMIAVEVASGLSLPRGVRALLAIAVTAAVVSNIGALRDGARYLRSQATLTRAELGVLDITRSIVNPDYVSLVPDFPFPVVRAAPYFAAEEAYGSPAANPAQIAASPEAAREAADAELIAIHHVQLQAVVAANVCGHSERRGLPSNATGPHSELTIPQAGLLLVAKDRPAAVAIRRFATQFQTIGQLIQSAPEILRIGPDRAPEPWRVNVSPIAARIAKCALP